MLSERILHATAAWLNGDVQHAWLGEQLSIQGARLAGDLLIVTYLPTEPGQVPFDAAFVLSSVEMQTSALIRQDETI
jgi:hypothetical protein